MIDIDAVRKDTPGTNTHIHFNNAGSAMMPRPVVQALHEYIDLEAAIGGYEAAAEKSKELEGVYESIARLVNGQTQEIAIVENATAAWCAAFYAMAFNPGDRILTCQSEYASNYLAFLQVARRTGAKIDVIANDETGAADIAALRAMIDARVKLIAITHIPTNGGLVNPAEEIGSIAREHSIFYLLDACQTVGQLPIDVEAIGCDALSATGRKFLRGPRGTGFLYMRSSRVQSTEPAMLDLFAAEWVAADRYEIRPDARRFENWENNYAGRLGLKVAADYATQIGMDAIANRAVTLANRLRDGIETIHDVQVKDLGRQKCAIVSLEIDAMSADAMKMALGSEKINCSVSGPDSTLLDANDRNLPPLLRLSPHYYNTEDEIDTVLAAIEKILKENSE